MIKKILVALNILLAVAVLALLKVNSFTPDEREKVIEITLRDTVIVYKTDTIVEYEVRYSEKKVVDTVWVEGEDVNIPLPVIQKYYQNKGVYDLWISGVEPLNIDSFKCYKQVEYAYITENVTKEQYKLYVGGGLFSFRETFTPYVSISMSEPKKWLISANFGLNGYLGVDLKYNIFSYDKR